MVNIDKSQSVFIDLIRGASAQIVLLGHLISFYFYEQQVVIQNLGVLVFFILSGHLITLSALKYTEGKFNFYQFISDRFIRIYVALFPAIVLCFLVDYFSIEFSSADVILFDVENLNINNAIASLFNLVGLPSHILSFITQGVIKFEPVGSMRPLWTVAIEWWLYVVIALAFLFFSRKKIIVLFTVTSCLLLAVQLFLNLNIGYFVISLWLLSSAYTMYNVNMSMKSTLFLLVASILCLSASFQIHTVIKFYEPVNMLLILVIYFTLLRLVSRVEFSSKIKIIAAFFSSYSYSLYLLHYTLIVLLKPKLGLGNWGNILVLFIIVNIVAFLFYLVFENKNKKIKLLFERVEFGKFKEKK